MNALLNSFENLSNKKFTALLLIIVLVKNGIHPIGTEWIDWVYSAGKEFPVASSYFSYSIIPISVAKILNFPSYITWWLFFGSLSLLFYIILIIRIRFLAGKNYKVWLLIFFTFPFFISPIYFLGHYDLITISGGALAALSNKKKFIFIGSLLAVGANAEQALMTSICMVIVAIGTNIKFHRVVASIWFTSSCFSYLMLRVFLGPSDDGNRIKIIFGQLFDVFLDSAGKINIIVYSVFGVGWIVLFKLFKYSRFNFHDLITNIGFILIPVLLSIFILDRTRIGVAVGALPLIIMLRYLLESGFFEKSFQKGITLHTLLVFALFVPSIFVDSDGSIRLPYMEFIKIFIQYT